MILTNKENKETLVQTGQVPQGTRGVAGVALDHFLMVYHEKS